PGTDARLDRDRRWCWRGVLAVEADGEPAVRRHGPRPDHVRGDGGRVGVRCRDRVLPARTQGAASRSRAGIEGGVGNVVRRAWASARADNCCQRMPGRTCEKSVETPEAHRPSLFSPVMVITTLAAGMTKIHC